MYKRQYLLHCLFMGLGNLAYFVFSADGSFAGVVAARLVVGLEGGVMYNANAALVEFSGPRHRVRYLSLYQFFVGFGLVLGPGLASASLQLGRALALADAAALANLVMAVWGAVLAAALLALMPSNDELARLSAEEGGAAARLSLIHI